MNSIKRVPQSSGIYIVDIGYVDEEALVRRARDLTKKIQVVAQTCWTSSQKWHSLHRPHPDVINSVRLTVKIVKRAVTTTKCGDLAQNDHKLPDSGNYIK